MSAQPVNVLAVMLADALAAEDWRVLKTGDRNAASARKFSDEARAAMAELIEALAMVDRIWSGDQTANIDPESPLAKVRGALTKVGAR